MKKVSLATSLAIIWAAAFLPAAGPAHGQQEDAEIPVESDEIEMITLDTGTTTEPDTVATENVAVDPDLSEFDLDDEDSDFDELEEFEDEQSQELSARSTDVDELRRSFELYKSALATASYDEADTLAKRMVELSIRLYGLDSHESSKALTNLGLVQQKNQDFESAVLNFIAAIDIIERIEDRLNSNLINPLRGLGSAQLGAGRPDLALQSYNRAVHVTHVNEGPHNLMQIDVLEDLAETYLSMGERDDAVDAHEHIYNIEARNTDMNSEEIIPALERQADFLHRMRMYEKERMTWRRVISILEDSRGKKDLSLIPPLTGLAKSYLFFSDLDLAYYSEPAITTGDTYLKRAMRIAEDNPDASWNVKKQTMLGLADYYTLSQRPSKARKLYEASWQLLSEDQERYSARRAALEMPHILQKIFPPKYFNSNSTDGNKGPPENFETGTIVLGYRVTDRGATRDVGIVDANPPGLEDFEYTVAREVRRLVHRPRMEDGIMVDTPDQTYVHEFYYRPSDIGPPTTPGTAPVVNGAQEGESNTVAAGEG